MSGMKRSFTREKKKRKAFLSLSVHVLSSLFFRLSSLCPPHVMFRCFCCSQKPQNGGKSHKRIGTVTLTSRSCTCCRKTASGDENEDYVFLLFNCAWPEEDVVPWEPGCMHALGAREGGLLALTGLSKQDKKRVCFLTSPLC